MNHKITLTQAVQGYLLAANARRLSPHTIADYTNTFAKFIGHFETDPPLEEITSHQVQEFFAGLTGLSNKTMLNYHVGLSALWTWAVHEALVCQHILRELKPPRPEKPEVIPFTETEVRLMLSTLGRSRPYARPGKRKSDHAIPHADRNRAIILLLLDTGLRASELCDIKIHQVDNRNRRIQVMGKGARERSVPFSPRTGQAIWRYLTTRPNAEPAEPLFASGLGRPINRDRLLDLLRTIGTRAGIADVHPHRFRHTFAIQFLRNGGDPYTLQALLGHSTLEMVKRYLAIAQIDIDTAHRRASPVDNWVL